MGCTEVCVCGVAGVLDRLEFMVSYAMHKNAEASAFYDIVDSNHDGEIDRQIGA